MPCPPARFLALPPWNRRDDHQDRPWYHSLSQDDKKGGAAMTGPEHYRRAEELAAEAHRLLGQGDGQATAGAWAAVAQTHAVPPGPGSDPAAVIIDA